MIIIPDYGCGNLASISRMFSKVGHEAVITSDSTDTKRAGLIVLAGVGAFDHGMSGLHEGGWYEALNEAVLVRRIPVLGICLGMQLMCRSSDEGDMPGFGWIDAEVRRFCLTDTKLKVPHMGWNLAEVQKENVLFDPDEPEERFYFVHSYHVVCANPSDVLTTTVHGYSFASSFQRDNIVGVQFHPEKSHRFGVELLRRFAGEFVA